MFHQRNRRLVMVAMVVWCVQLALTVFVIHQILHESTRYLLALQVMLLATLLFRSRELLRPFLVSFYRDRRYSQRASPEVVAERHRIARDLHDGIGSQLTTAMASLDPQNPKEFRLQQDLQMCLLDMRLMVDAMSPSNDPLTVRLASLRHRIQPALELRNIRLVWNIQPPDGLPIPSESTASEIVFIMVHEVERGVWRFEVCDNGVGLSTGLDAAPSSHGYGVRTMRDRALRAGLFLAHDTPASGGTRVRLEARGYWQFDVKDMFFS